VVEIVESELSRLFANRANHKPWSALFWIRVHFCCEADPYNAYALTVPLKDLLDPELFSSVDKR